MIGKEVLNNIKECDKYTCIIRLVAQSRGKNKKDFNEFIEHINNCPSCNVFYSERLIFDDYIQQSIRQVPPPDDLKSTILKRLLEYTR